MLATVTSCAVIGLEGVTVRVEVDYNPRGLTSFTIVGLPSAAVQESRERVRAAIRNSGLQFPLKRYVVNLAPANLRKEGPAYDLPIAVGVLAVTGQIPPDSIDGAMFIGELSLDGGLRHVRGVLPIAYHAHQQGVRTLYVPAEDAPEAALITGLDVIPIPSLGHLVEHLYGMNVISPYRRGEDDLSPDPLIEVDFADIKGQEHVKRALEVAAAGAHNVLMVGPPGGGKTLMARALPGILPSMTLDEAMEVTRIYSVADLLSEDTPLVRTRPFRSPHHTISHAGLVGGGPWPRPGEVSLAHRGVLFLDELPEFGHRVLDVLRQPIEDKRVTISRAQTTLTFPANFMLVAAMNPCPCGYYGDPVRQCTCTPGMVRRYQQRISGPLLDRFDIHVEVPRVEPTKLTDLEPGESSSAIRERVEAARERQRRRFAEYPHLQSNADMGPKEIRMFCRAEDAAERLLKAALRQMHLSARAYHRVLKVGRTIADLDGSDLIKANHIAEAIQYRPRRTPD